MKFTRRDAMTVAAAATTCAMLPRSAWGAVTQTRLSITSFSQNPKFVAAFRRGVFAMKGLPPADPQSWWWQGSVHHVDIASVPSFPSNKQMPSQAERDRYWDQCPHSLHEEGANEFLGWHAAYLLHFEEVLRAQSGEPSLSLPFWDYTDSKQRQLPAIFRDETVRVNADWMDDPEGQIRDNPLYEPLRNPDLAKGASLTASVVDVSWFPQVDDFTLLTPLNRQGWGYGFGGGRSQNQLGMLEVVPHGYVHSSVGGEVGNRIGLMGDTITAAFDPIFWVHHANIDRLWRRWLCGKPRSWGAFANKAAFDVWMAKKAWPFKTSVASPEILRPRSVYMSASGLPYVYEGETPGCAEPTLPGPKVVKGVGVLATSQSVRSFSTIAKVGANTAPLVVNGQSPASATLTSSPLPVTGNAPTKSVRSALMAAQPAAPVRLLLDVSGLSVAGYGSTGYDVFVNLPEGAKPTRENPHFVGVLNLFGTVRSPNGSHQHVTPIQTFDLTHLALATNASNPQVKVTFVPFATVERSEGSASPKAQLKVQSMELRLVRGSPLEEM